MIGAWYAHSSGAFSGKCVTSNATIIENRSIHWEMCYREAAGGLRRFVRDKKFRYLDEVEIQGLLDQYIFCRLKWSELDRK